MPIALVSVPAIEVADAIVGSGADANVVIAFAASAAFVGNVGADACAGFAEIAAIVHVGTFVTVVVVRNPKLGFGAMFLPLSWRPTYSPLSGEMMIFHAMVG